MNKKHVTIDRETALKQIAAAGGFAALLPLLSASAQAKSTHKKGGTVTNPMNLTYSVAGSTTSAMLRGKGKSGTPTPGTLTIQMWDEGETPLPGSFGNLVFSFDGTSITPNGHFNEHCPFDGKPKKGALHVKVYFQPT